MARKKKNDCSDALKDLIKPECDPEKTSVRKVEKASGDGEVRYQLTPAGILYSVLAEVYGLDRDMKKFCEFQKRLLKSLSELSTNGQQDDLFGDDFNSFYSAYVRTLNVCGRMQEVLKENGIDFDLNDDGSGEGEGDD